MRRRVWRESGFRGHDCAHISAIRLLSDSDLSFTVVGVNIGLRCARAQLMDVMIRAYNSLGHENSDLDHYFRGRDDQRSA